MDHLTLSQTLRTWWNETGYKVLNCRRGLSVLQDGGWRRQIPISAQPELPLAQPRLAWTPRQWGPSLGSLAYRLGIRWNQPLVQTVNYLLTRGVIAYYWVGLVAVFNEVRGAAHHTGNARQYLRAIPCRITNRVVPGVEIPPISGIRHAFWAFFFWGLGIIGAWVAVQLEQWLILPVLSAMAIHGSRKLQVNIGHACSHHTLTGVVWCDNIIGTVAHLCALATEFGVYCESHPVHHGWNVVATSKDPTFIALANAGIRPGKTKRELYRTLAIALFSPSYHLRVLRDRIQSHVSGWSPLMLFTLTWGLAVGLTAATGTWLQFLLAVGIPLVWGYQTSQLLRLCVEHRLPIQPKGKPRPVDEMQELTDGIVLRLSSPIDMSVRALVLTGDTVAHDAHHYHPASSDWSNYTAKRAAAKALADAKGRTGQYHEFTGFCTALDACFEAMSKAPEDAL